MSTMGSCIQLLTIGRKSSSGVGTPGLPAHTRGGRWSMIWRAYRVRVSLPSPMLRLRGMASMAVWISCAENSITRPVEMAYTPLCRARASPAWKTRSARSGSSGTICSLSQRRSYFLTNWRTGKRTLSMSQSDLAILGPVWVRSRISR